MTDWTGGLPVGDYNDKNLCYVDDTALIAIGGADTAEFLKRVKVKIILHCKNSGVKFNTPGVVRGPHQVGVNTL